MLQEHWRCRAEVGVELNKKDTQDRFAQLNIVSFKGRNK